MAQSGARSLFLESSRRAELSFRSKLVCARPSHFAALSQSEVVYAYEILLEIYKPHLLAPLTDLSTGRQVWTKSLGVAHLGPFAGLCRSALMSGRMRKAKEYLPVTFLPLQTSRV